VQNHRQKVFNGEGFTFVQGGFDKNFTIYSASFFNFWGLGALFGVVKPAKAPRGDGTGSMFSDTHKFAISGHE